MKIRALRYCGLAALLCASSWAVWGADGVSGHRTASPLVLKKPATPAVTAVAVADQESETKTTSSAPVATSRILPTTPSPVAPLAPRSAVAETGSTVIAAPDVRLSLSTLAPTPEMWFYERMRQDYDNPALQARLRGERAAAERRARLAARAWYGVSNGRPTAHITPFTYYYSPTWASNVVNPFFWTPPRTVPIIIETRRPTIGVSGFGVW